MDALNVRFERHGNLGIKLTNIRNSPEWIAAMLTKNPISINEDRAHSCDHHLGSGSWDWNIRPREDKGYLGKLP